MCFTPKIRCVLQLIVEHVAWGLDQVDTDAVGPFLFQQLAVNGDGRVGALMVALIVLHVVSGVGVTTRSVERCLVWLRVLYLSHKRLRIILGVP